MDWIEVYTNKLSTMSFIQHINLWILTHIPEVRAHSLSPCNHFDMGTLHWQVAFTIRALQSPTRLPEFMARFTLVQTSARDVAASLGGILNGRLVMKENLDVIRRTYEAGTIRNVGPDGVTLIHLRRLQGLHSNSGAH